MNESCLYQRRICLQGEFRSEQVALAIVTEKYLGAHRIILDEYLHTVGPITPSSNDQKCNLY